LTAAIRLAQLDIPFVLLDSAPAPSETSKASLVHAATLELLAELGVSDQLVAAGRRIHRIRMVDRGSPLLSVPLTGLPTAYPFGLTVPQSTTEGILLQRLSELAGSVRREHRVETVSADGTGYLVSGVASSSSGPAPFQVHARYVIGADGAHSTIRSGIGQDFPGTTYPSQFVLADVELTAPPAPDDEVTINMSGEGVTVIGRLPSGNYRIIATVDAVSEVPATPDAAYVQALLRRRHIDTRVATEPAWSSRFRVQHRVAERFRSGGVFLAGDAAHVHSPAAGQGMNTGIADAFDLSSRLAVVLTGRAAENALDDYENLRRPAALQVLRFTDRLTRISMVHNPAARRIRRIIARTFGHRQSVQRRITMSISGLERSPLRQHVPEMPYSTNPMRTG